MQAALDFIQETPDFMQAEAEENELFRRFLVEVQRGNQPAFEHWFEKWEAACARSDRMRLRDE